MAYLYDGQSVTFSLGVSGGIRFREKTVTPPSFKGGGPLDGTDMRNTTFRTKVSKKLLSADQIKMSGYYDPQLYSRLTTSMQFNQAINLLFVDFSLVTFYGWIEEFEPTEHKEGDNPLANFVLEVSNQNGSGVGVIGAEVPPAYSAPVQNGGLPLQHGQ